MQSSSLMSQRFEDLETIIGIDYSIPSTLGEVEEGRYIQNILANIYESSTTDDSRSTIGALHAVKILLGEAMNNISTVFLFDHEQYILDIGSTIFDFEKDEYVPGLTDAIGEIEERDILILNYIELHERFRGLDIGSHIIKDLHNNFISGCGLFIVNLGYPDIQKNKPMHKLVSYFNLIGFTLIPSVSNDLMFLSPTRINACLNGIELR